ncbi:MAG: 16S rRNA (guanine(527)-N(7))-methyltransferase RsmG [Gammaproteobacteria bacterium]|jgi:16S rRNA (guanine527-N7)-methyltransferase|nr:16S rRNA (guanine(527)-N(7))-methyltransferase RsmG [Gammaproteobacteria bacterium]
MQKHKDLLIEGSTKLGIELSVEKIEKLLHYLELIIKWNKVHNLTAIDDPSEGVKKHLLDSLSILSFIKKGRILDVGSGAGLPGIVIALMRDDVAVNSIDSVGKKCRFMEHARLDLNLINFNVVNDRVEIYNTNECFNQIVSRAFATFEDTKKLTAHLICPEGEYLFMKGKHYKMESISEDFIENKVNVPFVSEERFIIQMKA